MTLPVLNTGRLVLRPFALEDAPFIVRLLNDPDFVANIADKGVRSEADARRYLRDGPLAMYAEAGCGLLCVEDAATGEPAGMCGLLLREGLPAPDLGYALMPAFRGRGLATEAAEAALLDGVQRLGCTQVMAIVSPGNAASWAVLTASGFDFERHDADWPGGPVDLFRLSVADRFSLTVFFYGLYMDAGELRRLGVTADWLGTATAEGYALEIGRRANLVPVETAAAFGRVARVSCAGLEALYGRSDLQTYVPQPLVARLDNGHELGCQAWLLPAGPVDYGASGGTAYSRRLLALLRELGAPRSILTGLEKRGQ